MPNGWLLHARRHEDRNTSCSERQRSRQAEERPTPLAVCLLLLATNTRQHTTNERRRAIQPAGLQLLPRAIVNRLPLVCAAAACRAGASNRRAAHCLCVVARPRSLLMGTTTAPRPPTPTLAAPAERSPRFSAPHHAPRPRFLPPASRCPSPRRRTRRPRRAAASKQRRLKSPPKAAPEAASRDERRVTPLPPCDSDFCCPEALEADGACEALRARLWRRAWAVSASLDPPR